MDHKVSKDMISSGMIPSGEKTQSDLGRIQYGSAPSPSSLMDAYKSIYEHHQKDKDGNTIPHEGEELDENLAGIAAKGLQMASRGASKMSQMAAKGSVRAKQLQAQGGVKKALGGKLQSAKKKTALTSGQKEALLGRTTAGKITRGVGALAAANVAGRMASGNDNRGGYSSYDINFGYTPEGDTISEDLFDALKSALIEEGYDEKSVMKIMASVTPDLINEVVENYKKQENLDEIAPLALALPALAKGAAALLSKKAIAGAALKLGSKAAAKTVLKKGVAGAAKQGLKSAGKSMVKNPVNTALGASMVMPQGGGAAPQPQAQRAVTSGKRTAGMQRMDLDLFDVVKGQLLDEGLTEEECNDVMTTLTLEEINETLQLDEITGKLAMKASRAADMKRAQLAKAGDKAGAAAKAAQASRLYKGGAKRNIAKQDLSKPLNPQPTNYPKGKGASYQEKPGM